MDVGDLCPEPDPSFDRFARIIRNALDVPVALISVVEPDRQIFPGSVGLPEPYQTARSTPLTHSFCQYVVADDGPLIIADARTDERLRDNLAIEDLNVIAYAGFPLRRPGGETIGSVCAIDSAVHEWTPAQLRLLEDLAEVCSVELELRDSREQLRRSAEIATALSQRARLLLSLSEALAETITATDIATALQDVAAKHLECTHAGIWVLRSATGKLHYVDHPQQHWRQADSFPTLALGADNPVGTALLKRRPFYFSDRAAQDARFPTWASAPKHSDAAARAILPLGIGGRPLGTLVLTWPDPRSFTEEDRVTIAALTSYTAQALARADLLAERTSVAHTLQMALLPDVLPQPDHLDIAARYLAAAERDTVGGDWYDCIVMPGGATNIMVGDVEGHDVQAAAAMGGLRNMLRSIAWALDDPPSANVARLDRAQRDLGPGTHATLIFGRIEHSPHTGPRERRTLRWTNAGHPPPLLVDASGNCVVLASSAPIDCMLGVMPDANRGDDTVELPPGATLLLYTDGLVETRDRDLDTGIERVRAFLAARHELPLPDLLDQLLATIVGPRPADDVVVMAVRIPSS